MGHLRDKGFRIKVVNVNYDALNRLKAQRGVPRRLWSCHTGFVGNYIIEGHVPGDVITRLLREKPAVAGLGVPGMPAGSPGMEGPPPQPYTVFTFNRSGALQVYANIQP
ncbi:MAG: hypothetical protein O2807_07745 [bacterium]|nr:hypothetical protein [bacterium]